MVAELSSRSCWEAAAAVMILILEDVNPTLADEEAETVASESTEVGSSVNGRADARDPEDEALRVPALLI